MSDEGRDELWPELLAEESVLWPGEFLTSEEKIRRLKTMVWGALTPEEAARRQAAEDWDDLTWMVTEAVNRRAGG